jgi:hypothetical protein
MTNFNITYSDSVNELETEQENFDEDYSSEEISDYENEDTQSKYNIVVCELFNNKLHGNPTNNVLNLHYLVYSRFKNLNSRSLQELCHRRNLDYSDYTLTNSPTLQNNYIRNYKNIVSNQNYIKPEIALCIYLPSQECVAILKTFWIRLIQRKWKNILSERKRITENRSNIIAIVYREIYGTWPKNCSQYPTLNGMLSNLRS